jgi:riboflavin-specific deaminase-like protein
MAQPLSTSPARADDAQPAADAGWAIVQAASVAADRVAAADQVAAFALEPGGQLRVATAADPEALLAWRPGFGWEALLPAGDARRAIVDLYLPICSATAGQPIVIGHVGQSLDGFIAMRSGESQWITGEQNILHMHRLRALCDAVIVGAGTVAADDPQLTTRLVPGRSPLRVVIDPARRLAAGHRVFTDSAVETLYVCARSLTTAGESHFGHAAILGIDGGADGSSGIDPADLLGRLRARGCRRVFVEGGGATVSMFFEANLLDRLHITIAAVLLGDGRPAIRFTPPVALGDCPRPEYRVFRMGGDVLFDCDLRASTLPGLPGDKPPAAPPTVTRII